MTALMWLALIVVDGHVDGTVVGVGAELQSGDFETNGVASDLVLPGEVPRDLVVETELVIVAHAAHGMVRYNVVDLDLALATDGLVGVECEAEARFNESRCLLTREGTIRSR